MRKICHCGKCKKEIQSGSICTECRMKIDKILEGIKKALYKEIEKNEKKQMNEK